MTAVGSAEFSIGRVLGRFFSLLFKDSLALTGLTLLFYLSLAAIALVVFLVALLFVDDPVGAWQQLTQEGEAQGAPLDPEAETPLVVLMLVAVPAGIFAYGVFMAFVIERGMQKSLGVSAGFRETLRRSVRAGLPLIGVGIMVTFLFYLGLFLLVIPGFIILTLVCLAPAAAVIERAGVFGSLSRSAALTKGHRWRVFALVVIFFLVSTIPPYAVLILFAVIGGIMGPIGLGIMSFIATLIVVVYSGVVTPLYAAVMYHDLKLAKEGWHPDSIAAVFD